MMPQETIKAAPRVTTPESAENTPLFQNFIPKLIKPQGGESKRDSKTYNCHVRVPEWMSEKVLTLVTELNDIKEMRGGLFAGFLRDVPRASMVESLYQLEFVATTLLKGDLSLFPDLSTLVPEDFLKVLKISPNGSNLAPVERSAIVIIQADAEECCQALNPTDIEALVHLKWESLNRLLTEATNG